MAAASISNSIVAQRYASALFDVAVDKKSVDKVATSLQDLQAALSASVELRAVIASPVISVAELTKVMEAVLKGIKADKLVVNTVMLMVQKRRAAEISGLSAEYAARVAKSKGEVNAYISSAAPLSPSQEQELGKILAAKLNCVVRPIITIDPSLIGGLTVQVGSQMIDSSIKTKLQTLQLSLKGA